MLTNIDITKIFPHPDNPRQDLGDLTELAESIKTNGILQNLTVIPQDLELYQRKTGSKKAYTGNYTVIIGHRRLAAAKLAELKEVPCVITDMDMRTQVATMLLENMQRNDLTVWEQANGFQMMLNLGENVAGISEKTGFSQSTVRHRMKLLELDQGKLKESAERGATIHDYADLEKIENVDLRNTVLDKIGTANFKYTLQSALDSEKSEKNKAMIVAQLEMFATKVENTNELRQVKWYNSSNSKTDVEVPDDAGTTEYFFSVSTYGTVYLYTKKNAEETATKSQYEIDLEKRRERIAALDEIRKRSYQCRKAFVSNFFAAKKSMGILIEYAIRFMLNEYSETLDYQSFCEILNIELDENDEWEFDDISEQLSSAPERTFLIAVFCAIDTDEKSYDWQGNFEESEELTRAYDFLMALGYQVSDEERAMLDGTNELYTQNDKSEQD